MIDINALPADILHLIFLEVENPKIGRVCRYWGRLVRSREMVSLYLQKYETLLGKLFQEMVQRMHGLEFRSYYGFKGLLRRQWAIISFLNNGSKSEKYLQNPLCPERIAINERLIAENVECDLYTFGVTLLNIMAVQLHDEGFTKGIKLLIMPHESHVSRYKEVFSKRMGTLLWDIISTNIDLTIIKEVTIGPELRSIPREIRQLHGLERLALHSSRPFYVPAQIAVLPYLKHLDLGRNKKHVLAPELYESNNPVIKDAITCWKNLP